MCTVVQKSKKIQHDVQVNNSFWHTLDTPIKISQTYQQKRLMRFAKKLKSSSYFLKNKKI